MAQHIYDENGRKVGEIKSEEEKTREEHWSALDNIGCAFIIILGALSFLLAKPWLDVEDMIENFDVSGFWLNFQYIIALVAIVYGIKTVVENKLSLWGAFWNTVKVLSLVGIIGSVAIPLVYGVFVISFEDYLFSMWCSLFPAVIVTVCLLLKRRKH